MDVKEAARTAKDYLLDLFEGEETMNVGLEEIDFDDSSKSWSVTVGFSRPWDYSNKSPMTPTLFGELSQPLTRSYQDRTHQRSKRPRPGRQGPHAD